VSRYNEDKFIFNGMMQAGGRCSVLGLFHFSPRTEKEVPGELQQSRDEWFIRSRVSQQPTLD